ncbi:MAG: serine hydrolase [Deltaproteobacteria bacterium]|nr:MAG: serine hydrolase [Deltaproteobacteria bacterium]
MNSNLRELLLKGVEEKIYPGAVLVAGIEGKPIIRMSVGYSRKIPTSVPVKEETIFDLASLTKPFATSLITMKLVEKGFLDLDTRLSELISVPEDKKDITVRMLLSHSSGLPDWRPYYFKLSGFPLSVRKRLVIEWILKEELVFPPGRGELYSDLGFMLLAYVIEKICGKDLRYLSQHIYEHLRLNRTFLGHPEKKLHLHDFAATEICSWRKRVIQGEVHDENAAILGGYSGHSGLFSTADELFIISNTLLEHYYGERGDLFKKDTVKEFFKKQNNRWALGWDTPTGKSSSGSLFSRNSVGHLGFTGTSVWIDLDKKIIIILLTNRVHPSRRNYKIKSFRPIIHNQVVKTLLSSKKEMR